MQCTSLWGLFIICPFTVSGYIQLEEIIMTSSMRSQVSALSESSSPQNPTFAHTERQESHRPRFSYEQERDEDQQPPQHKEQQKIARATSTQYAPIQTTDSDDSPDTKSIQTPKRRPAASLASWAWECSAVCIAIASFIAIIVILRVYENRLLSTWGVPLTINAVVSILTTLFKGALALPIAEGISQLKWRWFSKRDRDLVDLELYDQASRGPWGSILLLVRQVLHKQRSYVCILVSWTVHKANMLQISCCTRCFHPATFTSRRSVLAGCCWILQLCQKRYRGRQYSYGKPLFRSWDSHKSRRRDPRTSHDSRHTVGISTSSSKQFGQYICFVCHRKLHVSHRRKCYFHHFEHELFLLRFERRCNYI